MKTTFCICVACIGLVSNVAAPAAAIELDELVAKVRANEALYRDVDVRWKCDFALAKPKFLFDDMLKSASSTGHYVSQGERFFVEVHGQQETLGGDVQSIYHVNGFDGEQTRLLEDRIANIKDRPSYDVHSLDPYMVPLRRFGFVVPFSVWLEGAAAIRAHPQGKYKEDSDIRCQVAGEETVAGLACVKVVADYLRKTPDGWQATDRREFYLARERNYLPILAKGFNLFKSDKLPVESTVLGDLREVAPGVWYPFHIEQIGYDEGALSDDSMLNVAHRWDYVVQSVDLKPAYDVGFFRAVEFPAGVSVYRVVDGEIVESYIQPKADEPTADGKE